MLDFPNNPNDGQVYVVGGTTFVWKATPGLWQIAAQNGAPVEIMEDSLPATTSGWAVWGDIMVQWAYLTPGVSPQTINFFPPYFKAGTTPSVAGTPETTDIRLVSFPSVSHNEFTIKCVNGAGVDTPTPVYLIAFGEAPDSYKKPKTVNWVGGGDPQPVDIIDNQFFGSNGWVVIGDVLMQWGNNTVSPSGAKITVNFTKAFAANPRIVDASNWGARNTTISGVTTTKFDAEMYSVAGGGLTDGGFSWLAIGPALPEDVMPKTVQTVGGAPLFEYHDPTRNASWRLIGNTLECWGTIATDGSGNASVTFPKTFARNPEMSVTPGYTSGSGVYSGAFTNLTPGSVGLIGYINGGLGVVGLHWRAIGEWDGVS